MKIFMRGFLFLIVTFFFIKYGYGDKYIEIERISNSKIPGNIVFSVFTSLTVDQKGNIFCVAKKENLIVKFDKDLNYVTSFGRTGKGPGDFRIESYSTGKDRLSIDDKGNIYFFDENPGRLVIFDNNGNYKRDIDIQRKYIDYFPYIFRVKVVASNHFTGLLFRPPDQYDFVFFQLEPVSIKLKYPKNERIIDFSHKGCIQKGISDFGYGPNLKFISDFEKLVFAESQRYRIYVYDLKGNKLFDIKDPSKKMGNFSDKELEKIGERFEKIKKRNPVTYSMLLEEIRDKKNVIADIKLCENRIVVFLVGDISVEGKYPVIIYDSKGKMVKEGYFKIFPVLLWKSYAYTLDNDTDDNPVICKYSIKDF